MWQSHLDLLAMKYSSLRLPDKSPKFTGWPGALSIWVTELLNKSRENIREPSLRITHHCPGLPVRSQNYSQVNPGAGVGSPGLFRIVDK